MALEAIAGASGHPGFGFAFDNGEIDPAPMFYVMRGELAGGKTPGWCADLFHTGLARAFAARAAELVEAGEAKAVALSGGCFQNARLLAETLRALDGLPVLIHTQVPANDGGLALGQAVIAAARQIPAR